MVQRWFPLHQFSASEKYRYRIFDTFLWSPRQIFIIFFLLIWRFFLDKEILPEIRCGLYPKIVPVQNGDGNVRNDPQFVMVNRCQGACDHGLAWQNCTATKWRSIDVIMRNRHLINPTRPVIEHEACECQCHVRCNDQIHERDVNNCQCNCKTRCKVDENQIPDTCECVPRAGKRNVLY